MMAQARGAAGRSIAPEPQFCRQLRRHRQRRCRESEPKPRTTARPFEVRGGASGAVVREANGRVAGLHRPPIAAAWVTALQ